jgi:hypothetical protein
MVGYDWALLADRGGEAVEGLIATFLNLRHSAARQINPSQGDGGVDVLLDTPEGIEVWQVKKFTRPLNSNQWRQVRNSWKRFQAEFVDKGVAVARYHLVTPWTPTRERNGDFEALTNGAEFPTQWDGEAFINGLADAYPATMDRFVNGPGAFERFVGARAMLAQSPVERTDQTTMLQAIEVRQSALDELRDSVSDNYRIDYGTRTMSDLKGPPMPDPNDPAVFHRMTYLGENRWRTESVVPRSAEAANADPIHLEITFLVKEGSSEHKAVREWAEWGTPFTDIPARTITRGGPFGSETHEDSNLSFVQRDRSFPALYFILSDDAGAVRFRLPLTVVRRTQGNETGWLHLVAETPLRTLHFDFHFKDGTKFELDGTAGNVDGLDPAQVLLEIEMLTAVDPSDSFSIEMQNGRKLVNGTGMTVPEGLTTFYKPIVHGLSELQSSTRQVLVMPEVMEVTMGQLKSMERYVSIYGGTPEQWSWSDATLRVPIDPATADQFLRQHLPDLLNDSMMLVLAERPLIKLAEREFLIERPLMTTRRSYRLDPELDLETLKPGDPVRLVPGEDDSVTTAALVDWTPGAIIFPSNDEGERAG